MPYAAVAVPGSTPQPGLFLYAKEPRALISLTGDQLAALIARHGDFVNDPKQVDMHAAFADAVQSGTALQPADVLARLADASDAGGNFRAAYVSVTTAALDWKPPA